MCVEMSMCDLGSRGRCQAAEQKTIRIIAPKKNSMTSVSGARIMKRRTMGFTSSVLTKSVTRIGMSKIRGRKLEPSFGIASDWQGGWGEEGGQGPSLPPRDLPADKHLGAALRAGQGPGVGPDNEGSEMAEERHLVYLGEGSGACQRRENRVRGTYAVHSAHAVARQRQGPRRRQHDERLRRRRRGSSLGPAPGTASCPARGIIMVISTVALLVL